jgi:hypothetical protein
VWSVASLRLGKERIEYFHRRRAFQCVHTRQRPLPGVFVPVPCDRRGEEAHGAQGIQFPQSRFGGDLSFLALENALGTPGQDPLDRCVDLGFL